MDFRDFKLAFLLTMCVSTATADGLPEAFTRCAFPAPPTIVDASAASEDEMVQASQAMADYVRNMTAQLACIDAEEVAGSWSHEERAWISAFYNNGVEQLTSVARAHNEQVARYRKRQHFELNQQDIEHKMRIDLSDSAIL